MRFLRFTLPLACAAFAVAVIAVVPKIMRYRSVHEAERLLQRDLPPPATDIQKSALRNQKSEINLAVPFTPQAPHADWDMPYREACEEAAVLMAIRYAFGNPISGPDDADTGILDLVRTNGEILGYSVDQTAEQVQRLIREIDPAIAARLIHNPDIAMLQRELSEGNVIIVPVAGRKLKNPFYRRPGPLYHMLVLRGFTSDGYFITNDPGTKRGEGYLYPFATIMEAIHDFVPQDRDIEKGGKIAVVVEPLNLTVQR